MQNRKINNNDLTLAALAKKEMYNVGSVECETIRDTAIYALQQLEDATHNNIEQAEDEIFLGTMALMLAAHRAMYQPTDSFPFSWTQLCQFCQVANNIKFWHDPKINTDLIQVMKHIGNAIIAKQLPFPTPFYETFTLISEKLGLETRFEKYSREPSITADEVIKNLPPVKEKNFEAAIRLELKIISPGFRSKSTAFNYPDLDSKSKVQEALEDMKHKTSQFPPTHSTSISLHHPIGSISICKSFEQLAETLVSCNYLSVEAPRHDGPK